MLWGCIPVAKRKITRLATDEWSETFGESLRLSIPSDATPATLPPALSLTPSFPGNRFYRRLVSMKNNLLLLTSALMLLGAALATRGANTPPPAPPFPLPTPKAPPQRKKRLEWFRHDKFGLFIHWGLYSIPPVTGRASAHLASVSGS